MYNLYRSQIWYTAHALSMLFERLFQGWVTSFIDGSIPITDPLGQPWESSCRTCLYEGDDDQMILCDHCDAAFHTYCLKPKLAKVRVCLSHGRRSSAGQARPRPDRCCRRVVTADNPLTPFRSHPCAPAVRLFVAPV